MDDTLSHGGHGSGDKSGVEYWNGIYSNWKSQMFNPHLKGLRYHGRRTWHSLFTRIFDTYAPPKGSLIEVGCGGAPHLPYLAREFGFAVSGIDYSRQGCFLGERNLKLAQVKGNIYNKDIFSPPQELIGSFDVAVSFGLVEHFFETIYCIEQIVCLLRPGGLMVTTIPNMAGLSGLAQKILARDVYEKHISLSKENLSAAHETSGLTVLEANYLEFVNFGVVNAGETISTGFSRSLRKLIHKSLLGFTLGVWIMEKIFGPFRGNALTSPYVYCIGRGSAQ